jgi:uncharacterized repeat protein (TIGR01451 family)
VTDSTRLRGARLRLGSGAPYIIILSTLLPISEELVSLIRRGTGTSKAAKAVLLGGCLVVLAATAVFLRKESRVPSATVSRPAVSVEATHKVRTAFGQLPMAFEPNLGQSDTAVKYVARGSGYALALRANEAVLNLHGRAATSEVSMRLEGAAASPALTALDPLPGHSNYLRGNDSSKWLRNVPQFARVRYEQVYPGIDLVYYGKRGALEYDFVLAPGADPSRIALAFEGAKKLALDADGNLDLDAESGKITLEPPRVYQVVNGERRDVAGRYVLSAVNHVGVNLGCYDRSRELVIDPVINFSRYFGGSQDESAQAVAVDTGLNIYVTGTTTSDGLATTGVYQTARKGGSDVFVAKFDPSGATLLYVTYLGGSLNDAPAAMAVDNGFDVYVAGSSNSQDFPTTTSVSSSTTITAGTHGFLSKLDSAGATLLYSTYLAGSGLDNATGLAIDGNQHAYLTGTTTSTDFPTTNSAPTNPPGYRPQFPSGASMQIFVCNIDTSLTGTASLITSTFFGGKGAGTYVGGGITLDNGGNIFITGGSNAADFPLANAYTGGDKYHTGLDTYIVRFPHSLGTIDYSNYLGGSGDDVGTSIAVDSANNTYVAGSTTSADVSVPALPSGITAFQAANGGGQDTFIAKINRPSTGNVSLVYFSYLGGSGTDTGTALAVDSSQNIYVVGSTNSTNFPTLNAFQSASGGGSDAFITKLDINGKGLYSSYLGGSLDDAVNAVTVDPLGNAYLAGRTASSNFPVVPAASTSRSGPSDAFLTKIGGISDLSVTLAPSLNPVGAGNQEVFAYTVKNNGPDTASGVVFTSILSDSNASYVSASASPGTCTTPAGAPPTLTCSLSTLAAGASATVDVVLAAKGPGHLSNSGSVSTGTNGAADPNLTNNTASASVNVIDFDLSITAPAATPPAIPTQTVKAGSAVTYTVQVAPVPSNSVFPNSVGLSCTNLPTGVTCAFSTQTIPAFTNSSPVTSTLTVNTTAPPKSGALRTTPKVWYATWLPLSGFALVGLAGLSRRRRLALVCGALVVCGLIVFQPACSKSSTTTTGGTPPGNYTISVTGTSGTAFAKTKSIGLVVN